MTSLSKKKIALLAFLAVLLIALIASPSETPNTTGTDNTVTVDISNLDVKLNVNPEPFEQYITATANIESQKGDTLKIRLRISYNPPTPTITVEPKIVDLTISPNGKLRLSEIDPDLPVTIPPLESKDFTITVKAPQGYTGNATLEVSIAMVQIAGYPVPPP